MFRFAAVVQVEGVEVSLRPGITLLIAAPFLPSSFLKLCEYLFHDVTGFEIEDFRKCSSSSRLILPHLLHFHGT